MTDHDRIHKALVEAAERIAAEMSEKNPGMADVYRSRVESYKAQLDKPLGARDN